MMGTKNGPSLPEDSGGTGGLVSSLGEQVKTMEQHCLLF